MRPYDRRLAGHARSTRPYLAVCVLIGVLSAACVIAQSWLLAHAIAAMTVPLALFGVFAVRAVLVWSQEWAAHRASASVKAELRTAVLASAVPGRETAATAALITRGVDALDPYFSRYLPQLVLAVVVPVAILGVLFAADPSTAGIVALTVPLIPLFGWLVGSYTAARTRRQWKALEVLAGHFQDVVSGLATLKVFGRAKFQADEIARVSGEHRKATMASLRIAFSSALVLELAATLSVAIVAVSVGLRLVGGSLSLETALFVLIVAPEAYLPFRQAGAHFHAAQEGLAAAERIFTLLDAPRPASTDRPDGTGPPRISTLDLVARDGLAPVTLTLEPGSRTAIVGPSGTGKSSFADVLLGLRAPISGRISASTDPARTAWLPQHPHFFAGTVAENIALGVPGAPAAAVREAAKATGVLAFTGLHVRLADEGRGLSAGQLQRIALARIVLRCRVLDIGLVVLDEPTAHLDAATEQDVAEVIDALAPGRTTLVITHRPYLAARADHVLSWPVQAGVPSQRTAAEAAS